VHAIHYFAYARARFISIVLFPIRLFSVVVRLGAAMEAGPSLPAKVFGSMLSTGLPEE
jgi:hypothetical protein